MKTRESRLQNGIFVYKRGISLTKLESHLQNGILGVQTGLSGCYLPEGYVTDGSHINFELTEAKSAGNAYPWNIKVENSKEKAPVVVESTPTLATPAAPLATTAGHTGDESNMMLYLAMMALAAAGIAVYGFKRYANR